MSWGRTTKSRDISFMSRAWEHETLKDTHNATGRAVPLSWLVLDSHLTVDLIATPKMLLNIRKVRGEDAIRVHCNRGVKIVDRVGDLPGYRNFW